MSLAELWATTRGKLGRLVAGSLLFTVLAFGPLLLAAAGGRRARPPRWAAPGVAPRRAAGARRRRLRRPRLRPLLARAGRRRAGGRPGDDVAAPLLAAGAPLELARARASCCWRWSSAASSSQLLQLPFALFAGDGGPLSALSGEAAQSLTTRAVVLSALGTGVASTLVAPFTAGVTALLYVDRRMRAEGLDVALQAAAAERR